MPRIKERTPKMEITIGADPELFAIDSSGHTVSVHDLLPGTKASPVKVPFGGIQVDGIAAEFNIQPAKSRREFMTHISHVRTLLEMLLKDQRPDLRLSPIPTAYFDQTFLDNLPMQARALGCEPDYNAYTGKVNPKPRGSVLFRTGAGHIHTGWGSDFELFKSKHFDQCCGLTKELDFVLYTASKVWDKDTTRQQLYGKPGAFRPKPYGMEYRVLSNAWLHHPMLSQYVYDATRAVTELFFKGVQLSVQFGGLETIEGREKDYWALLERNRVPVITNYAFS